MPILELKDVRYSYSSEKVVLRGVNCVFECGTLYALVGKSGAGKSTLLSLMAGLDLPDSGQVLFEGTPTGDMDLDEYRRRKAAVIYQDFALFPMLTALENIEYPMELCHVDAKEARQQAAGAGPAGVPAGGAAGPLSHPHQRRRAAACGHRPGPDHGPAAAAGRRAHRQLRQREQRQHHRPAAEAGP